MNIKMDCYDIQYEIAQYCEPHQYSCINKSFLSIALLDPQYKKIVAISRLYKEGKYCMISRLVSINKLIRWIKSGRIGLPFVESINVIIRADTIFVYNFELAIKNEDVVLAKFLKNRVYWLHDYDWYALDYKLFIESNIEFIKKVGITPIDIRRLGRKAFYKNIDKILECINTQSVVDTICNDTYMTDDVIWKLIYKGYYVGCRRITYKMLVKSGQEHYVQYIHTKSYILSHCKLDVINTCSNWDTNNVNVYDIIQNRHYPVFKTFYNRSMFKEDLLQLAVNYYNTEAFDVLTSLHTFSKEQLLSLNNVNAKGIKRIIKKLT